MHYVMQIYQKKKKDASPGNMKCVCGKPINNPTQPKAVMAAQSYVMQPEKPDHATCKRFISTYSLMHRLICKNLHLKFKPLCACIQYAGLRNASSGICVAKRNLKSSYSRLFTHSSAASIKSRLTSRFKTPRQSNKEESQKVVNRIRHSLYTYLNC
jgi:hypothetical protein